MIYRVMLKVTFAISSEVPDGFQWNFTCNYFKKFRYNLDKQVFLFGWQLNGLVTLRSLKKSLVVKYLYLWNYWANFNEIWYLAMPLKFIATFSNMFCRYNEYEKWKSWKVTFIKKKIRSTMKLPTFGFSY